MKKRLFILAIVLFASAGMVFAGGQSEQGTSSPKGPVTVGAKNFTEQYIMGQIMSQLLEANGFKVNQDFGMSSTVVRKGLETGQVDLYADYTGTAWVTYLKNKDVIHDPQKLYQAVKAQDAKNGIDWIEMLPVNNTYALAVKQSFAKEHNLSTLSDLAALVNKNPNKYKFAIDYEFFQRPDGFMAMAKDYGMNVPKSQVKTMEIGLTYQAIDQGDVDVAMVFSTDGRLKKFDMTVLKDDKQFFPPYNLAICVRKNVLDKYPKIKDILAPLSSKIDQQTMVNLNYQVDAEKKEPVDVAKAFLQNNNLISK